jgi:hypothetical protein
MPKNPWSLIFDAPDVAVEREWTKADRPSASPLLQSYSVR